MTKYLVVLGAGQWVRRKARYDPGIHEVDEETAAAALRAGSSSLLVFDERPEIVHHADPTGMLTADDIKFGVKTGVQFPEEPTPEEPARPTRNYDHSCQFCNYTAPASGSLARHVEFEHTLKAP
jgi:hypothetical protein